VWQVCATRSLTLGDTRADSRQYCAFMRPRNGASRTAQEAARELPLRTLRRVAAARGRLAIGGGGGGRVAARVAEREQIVTAPISAWAGGRNRHTGDGFGRSWRRGARATKDDAFVVFRAIYVGSADAGAVATGQRPALPIVLDEAGAVRIGATRELREGPGRENEPVRERCWAHARNIVQNRRRTA
jgi:hypothetical protein